MAIINLGNQPIAGASSVTNLTFDVTARQFPTRIEEDRVVVGKPLAGSGDIGITTVARFSAQGVTQNHFFGLKQIAFHKFATAEYSGLKNIDGSITEGTSTINQSLLLDVAVFIDVATGAITAPHAPFYAATPTPARLGAKFELTVKDAPGGAYPVEKRNHITDRLNFLDSVGMATDFVLALVVQLPDKSHQAIAGFRWSFTASVDVKWEKGKPKATGTATHALQGAAARADLSAPELAVLENPRLSFNDSIVARVNRSKTSASTQYVSSPIGATAPAKFEGGGYLIEQFDHFNNVQLNSAKTAL